MLEKEIGVDKALNYKSPNFKREFEEAVGYLDVYFDNVGGDILNLALSRMKVNARIVMCGKSINKCCISMRHLLIDWVWLGAISDYSQSLRNTQEDGY